MSRDNRYVPMMQNQYVVQQLEHRTWVEQLDEMTPGQLPVPDPIKTPADSNQHVTAVHQQPTGDWLVFWAYNHQAIRRAY